VATKTAATAKRKSSKKTPKKKYVKGPNDERVYVRKDETPRQALARHIRQLKKAAIVRSMAVAGDISAAARAAGVHRSTVYEWFEDDPKFEQDCMKARGGLINQVLNYTAQVALGQVREKHVGTGTAERLFLLKTLGGLREDGTHRDDETPDEDGMEVELVDGEGNAIAYDMEYDDDE